VHRSSYNTDCSTNNSTVLQWHYLHMCMCVKCATDDFNPWSWTDHVCALPMQGIPLLVDTVTGKTLTPLSHSAIMCICMKCTTDDSNQWSRTDHVHSALTYVRHSHSLCTQYIVNGATIITGSRSRVSHTVVYNNLLTMVQF